MCAADAKLLALQESIESISHAEYYAAWIKIMNAANVQEEAPPQRYPAFRLMIERMLLIKPSIIDDLVGALERHDRVTAAHREKLRAVLLWRRRVLQSRAVVYGNPN